LISIVIPTYRREDDLRACVESIRNNSLWHNEIIILCPEVTKRIAEIGEVFDCRLINDNSRSQGGRVRSLWAILNDGIEAACNEYVAWLNDDCTVRPGWDRTALEYFREEVGLVVLKTSGIGQSPRFQIIRTRFDVPCANYAVLRKKLPVRFDERFHWFHGDADISLQILYSTEYKVTSTDEGLVVHNHRVDATRQSNESDPKAVADDRRFKLKWRYTKLVDERVVDLSYSERALKLAKLVIRGPARVLLRRKRR
jgi:hypothetical protein